MSSREQGKLVIVSGPSGAGKSSVVQELLRICPLPLQLSVSATTRPPRSGERDGMDYHFLTKGDFERRQAQGDFLESKEVFGRGNWYGTLVAPVAAGLREGKWVVLEIDVDGAMTVLQQHPEAITVFVHCGSVAELERRLRHRGTESESSFERRMEVARRELALMHQYRHQVINQTISVAAQEICDLLRRYVDPL